MQYDDLFLDVTLVKERKPYLRYKRKLLSVGIDYSSRLLPRRGQRLEKILLIAVMDFVYEHCLKHCSHGLCPENCTTKTFLHSVNECVNKNVTSSIA